METWKDVIGFEGLYCISSYGRIKTNAGLELKQRKDKDGYLIVTLYKGGVRHYKKVHRLVGKAFIDNPHDYPIINHKDENPANNHAENLEWCTTLYNNNYGNRNKKISEKLKGVPRPYMQGCRNYFYGKHFKGGLHPRAKKVLKIDSNGNVIDSFDSTCEAAESVGCTPGAITMCCKGLRGTIKGYKWSYA